MDCTWTNFDQSITRHAQTEHEQQLKCQTLVSVVIHFNYCVVSLMTVKWLFKNSELAVFMHFFEGPHVLCMMCNCSYVMDHGVKIFKWSNQTLFSPSDCNVSEQRSEIISLSSLQSKSMPMFTLSMYVYVDQINSLQQQLRNAHIDEQACAIDHIVIQYTIFYTYEL